MKEVKYFVIMKNEDPMVVTVKEDVNRPNNPNTEDVLDDYMVENYGLKVDYEHYELDTCEKVSL